MPAPMQPADKIVLYGGAGLVGQNLVILLLEQGFHNLVVIDKHGVNLDILKKLHPGITAISADLAEDGSWQEAASGARAAVMLQAQIGGNEEEAFRRNNILATGKVLESCRRHGVSYLVHISSSVVNSMARDWYTESKKEQEALVKASGMPHCVLRPTLMFGWFDRKHLGWLSRFMSRTPVFPIPGSGRYLRQPLYAMDFCRIILACLQRQPDRGVFDISGRESIDYIDIIRSIKRAIHSRTLVLRIPYSVFWLLLKIYALIDRDPPFTTKQLKALVTPDVFVLNPWWEEFGFESTSFDQAVAETFGPSRYKEVTLEF